jgi:hypothetical protein
LNAVEGQDLIVDRLPHLLVIGFPTLYLTPNTIDKLGVCDCDFEISMLLIALEAIDVLSHDNLDCVYDGSVLGELSLEVGPVRLAVRGGEVDGCSDVEVVQEVGDMKEY